MLAGPVSQYYTPAPHVEGPREGYAFTPVKCLLHARHAHSLHTSALLNPCGNSFGNPVLSTHFISGETGTRGSLTWQDYISSLLALNPHCSGSSRCSK